MIESTARAVFPEDPRDEGTPWDASFVRFIQTHDTRIIRGLAMVCDDTALAEDAFQEAMIVAHAKWEVVSRHADPLAWVRKTAHYKLRLRMEPTGRDDAPVTASDQPATQLEAQTALRHLLLSLPVRQREVLALTADGCTSEQTAQQLGLALATVRTYRAAARRRWREMTAPR